MTTDVLMTQTDQLFDMSLDAEGDLTNGDFFDSSLQYSLLGERRASASEMPTSQYRRGWIGNEGTDFENGSKLWLLEQAVVNRTTLNEIQTAALNGLIWFVDDGILVNIEVDAVVSGNGVGLMISLFRPNSKVDKRFFELWNNTGTN